MTAQVDAGKRMYVGHVLDIVSVSYLQLLVQNLDPALVTDI